MNINWDKIKELIEKKLKYAIGGGMATAIDYGIYFSVVNTILPPVLAQAAAYSVSVIANFFFQKAFVFDLERSTKSAFGLSMLVSGGGLILSSGIIYGLTLYPFFQENQLITKLLTTAIVFFYNFYFKRYIFEKRFV